MQQRAELGVHAAKYDLWRTLPSILLVLPTLDLHSGGEIILRMRLQIVHLQPGGVVTAGDEIECQDGASYAQECFKEPTLGIWQKQLLHHLFPLLLVCGLWHQR